MSNPGEGDLTPITSLRQLADYLATGAKAPDRFRIGTEHEKFGFRRVGLLPGIAYRYGRWADTVMVQRSLAAGSTEPPELAGFGR